MRSRPVLAGLALFVLAFAVVAFRWWASVPPSPEVEVVAETPAAEPEVAETPEPAERQQTVQVRRGDNVVAVLLRAGIPAAGTHEIAAALRKGGADLRRLRPGDTIEITWSPADEATSVTWQQSAWRGYTAVAGENGE